MTFLSAAQSVQDSEPREYVEISINSGVTIYRHASGNRDLQIGAVLYTAIAMMRSEIGVNAAGDNKECILTLPIDHALAGRYTQLGVPPKKITVTVWRQDGGEEERIWIGDVTSMSVEGGTAKFRIPARAGEALLRQVPNVGASHSCVHQLYDTMCAISRAGSGPTAGPHLVTTTVLYVNGRDVRVDLSTVPVGDISRADWAEEGELVHVSSGERMTIRAQADLSPGISTVTTLTMQMPIVGIAVGDSVQVFAGCLKDIVTCSAKFANKNRFGGFPQLPTKNPFVPSGFGVAEKL